jgi:hypothetical protein
MRWVKYIISVYLHYPAERVRHACAYLSIDSGQKHHHLSGCVICYVCYMLCVCMYEYEYEYEYEYTYLSGVVYEGLPLVGVPECDGLEVCFVIISGFNRYLSLEEVGLIVFLVQKKWINM